MARLWGSFSQLTPVLSFCTGEREPPRHEEEAAQDEDDEDQGHVGKTTSGT